MVKWGIGTDYQSLLLWWEEIHDRTVAFWRWHSLELLNWNNDKPRHFRGNVSVTDPNGSCTVVISERICTQWMGKKFHFSLISPVQSHRVSPRWLLTSESGWCSRLLNNPSRSPRSHPGRTPTLLTSQYVTLHWLNLPNASSSIMCAIVHHFMSMNKDTRCFSMYSWMASKVLERLTYLSMLILWKESTMMT